MRHDQLVKQVQERAGFDSRDEAEDAVRATLETLAERLAGGEAEDLAAQLPPETAEYLQHEDAGAGESFSLDEFFERVSEREGTDDPAEAASHARAVIEVVEEAVTAGEMGDIRSQLPLEYASLFE